MPVNPIVPSTWELRTNFELPGGQTMVNTFNVEENAATLDQTLANTIATVIYTNWTGELGASAYTGTVLRNIMVTDLSVANGAQFSVPVNQAGSDSTDPLPLQSAAVINWRTNTRGPSYRGRTFLGGFAEGASTGVGPDAALATGLANFAQALIDDFDAAGHELVIVSRYEHNGSPPPISIPRATNITTPVTSFIADTYWKTMKSRAPAG